MSGSELAKIDLSTGELVEFQQGEAAMKIHSLEAMERLAKQIHNAEALERALTSKLEYQREFAIHYQNTYKVGRPENSDRTGRISADEFCQQFGFTARNVRRWVERLIDTAKFEAEKNKIVKKCAQLAELWQSASFSSESVEWYTPGEYIEAVREALGGIDLDPASSEFANQTVSAKQIFTRNDDGLTSDWHGRVFLNPPYGKKDGDSLASAFCQKAIAEYDLGNIDAAVILVNSVHSQNWQACLYDFPVCFVDHRIKFVSGDGEKNENPTFQNIFVYLGKDKQAFAKAFSKFGYVMERISGN